MRLQLNLQLLQLQPKHATFCGPTADTCHSVNFWLCVCRFVPVWSIWEITQTADTHTQHAIILVCRGTREMREKRSTSAERYFLSPGLSKKYFPLGTSFQASGKTLDQADYWLAFNEIVNNKFFFFLALHSAIFPPFVCINLQLNIQTVWVFTRRGAYMVFSFSNDFFFDFLSV